VCLLRTLLWHAITHRLQSRAAQLGGELGAEVLLIVQPGHAAG
jgi:hypothetical protein